MVDGRMQTECGDAHSARSSREPPSLSQDAVFELKRQLKGGSLTVGQAVPAGKKFLIPSPAVKVRCHRHMLTPSSK